MPKHACKVDNNQKELVQRLRDWGCSVQPLHAVGAGVPDLLAAYPWSYQGRERSHTFLVEVKAEGRKPRLTPKQVQWHGAWQGRILIARTVDDIDRYLRQVRRSFMK